MIDIHHHCLPGIDDGPREWDEAVELCRIASEEGIETIVATPHVLRGRWQNTSRTKLDALIEGLRERTGDKPRLLLGSEYFFAHDMTEVLLSGGGIVPLAGSRYVLVEFASHAVPPLIEQAFYRVQLEGWTPIIAHPERNVIFQTKRDLLQTLVRLGARTQITLGSLTGKFGTEAERAATAWLGNGLVHFLATDAHNCANRPPRVREALGIARQIAGDAVVDALIHGNPSAVIKGNPLVYEPDLPYATESAGFLSRLRKLLVGRENSSR